MGRSPRNDATLATKRDYEERIARATGKGTRGPFDDAGRTRASESLSDVDVDALGVLWRGRRSQRRTERTPHRRGDVIAESADAASERS